MEELQDIEHNHSSDGKERAVPNSLDELNAAFQMKREEKVSGWKGKNKKHIQMVIVSFVVITVIILSIWKYLQRDTVASDQIALPKDILTEEELEKWEDTGVDSGQVFFELNTLWLLDEGEDEIYIRLLNPPYSAYPLKVEIYLKDYPEEILYRSDILHPGSIIENAKLEPRPEKGEYTAVVKYSFYESGDEENIFGTHEVEAQLEVLK